MARKTSVPRRGRGRPRKDVKVDHFELAAMTRVTVKLNGEERVMTLSEAEAEKLWTDALNGDRRAMAEVIRRERELEAPLPRAEEEAPVVGPLVVSAPMSLDEWEAAYGGLQIQPTLPVLEGFREQLGLPPSNAGWKTSLQGE